MIVQIPMENSIGKYKNSDSVYSPYSLWRLVDKH
jgi:hypothetical protein